VTSYVALLRGVNLVGSRTILMADLKAAAKDLGFDSPRTFIASGNLLFSSPKPERELKLLLEKRIRDHFGAPVGVMIRTAAELERVVAGNPFTANPGNQVQAFFLDSAPPQDAVATARNCDDEQIALGEREVYVAYGERGIGRSRLRIPIAELGTARNMNTVARLAELAKEGA
jgi:uncharacterized protein (DUF1697 family)